VNITTGYLFNEGRVILIQAELTEPIRPVLIPAAALSKASVCRSSLTGIVGLNPAGGMDVCLL
jgi:hypothetical protein